MIFRIIIAILTAVIFLPIVSSADQIPPGFREHKIRQGDLLGKIAPQEHWDMIRKANRLDEFHLVPGRKLLLPHDVELAKNWTPVPEKIDGACPEREVRVFLDSQFFGAYENGRLVHWGPISSGRPGYRTPTGKFQMIWKAKDYYSKKYAADMPFAINFSAAGYFMHAQAMPGRPASHGCIRLLKSDAKKLFDWIRRKDTITIM